MSIAPRRIRVLLGVALLLIAGRTDAQTTLAFTHVTVIDGRGKYLVAGLWDMHVHTVTIAGRDLLGLYVANGVTGVRDMASDWPTLRAWRSDEQ